MNIDLLLNQNRKKLITAFIIPTIMFCVIKLCFGKRQVKLNFFLFFST